MRCIDFICYCAMILQMKEGVIMDERIIELAAFYQAMGYPLYDEEHLKEMKEEELQALYETTFPNRDE